MWKKIVFAMASVAVAHAQTYDNAPAATAAPVSKIGIVRRGIANNNVTLSSLVDTNGSFAYEAGRDRFTASIFVFGNLGFPAQATDIPVAGDWLGDGRSSIGIYRPTTGQWFLDVNDNGIIDAADIAYNFGGIAGDIPVVGDWQGIGRSCVGIFRGGFFWLLDWNCNGVFESNIDATFPFGGIPGDVPVVGSWTGTAGFRVGVVRKYAPGGVPQGVPFYWVLDGAPVASGPGSVATHQPSTAPGTSPFPFGGASNGLDVFVTGDWLGTGVYRAGIYRQGNWILDLVGAHTYDTFVQFGGLPADTPIVGRWVSP